MSCPEHIFENEPGFLVKLRTALAPDSHEARSKKDFPHIFSSADDRYILERIESRNEIDHAGFIASFQENSKPLNLGVHIVATLQEAADCIAGIARTARPEFGASKHIIQHMHRDLQELRLWKLLENEPISVHTTFPDDPELGEKTRESFIGITVADWGVAESATLVQITAPGRPRSTSLVPSIHIGLLRKTRMLSNLAEAYAMLRRNRMTRSTTFISGPSKTADIEAHMVHGAHGPKEMHVIVVD